MDNGKESISIFKILDENYEEFDASFCIKKLGDHWSLIIESGGGGRYRDYRHALDAILERFRENNAVLVDLTLESTKFLEKPIEERRIDTQLPVSLKEVLDLSDFRKQITRKASHVFAGGNNNERRLGFEFYLPLNLDQEALVSVLKIPRKDRISSFVRVSKNRGGGQWPIAYEEVLKAISECEEKGSNQFIQEYGFGESTRYQLLYRGRYYPPKAIVGVAGALKAEDFSGGIDKGNACWCLTDLGFQVEEIAHTAISGDEAGVSEVLTEGARKMILVNAYERDPKARKLCLEEYGYSCSVCGFNFEEKYGDIGKWYIHVHHLTDLSLLGEEHEVDPIEDLRPLCPNCHAMIHKQRPAFSIKELQEIIQRLKQTPSFRERLMERLKDIKAKFSNL